MLKSSLCYYSDACTLAKGTIFVAALTAGGGNDDKLLIFKNYSPFIYCICETHNTEIDNAKEIDVVLLMYNLTECSCNCSKTSGIL